MPLRSSVPVRRPHDSAPHDSAPHDSAPRDAVRTAGFVTGLVTSLAIAATLGAQPTAAPDSGIATRRVPPTLTADLTVASANVWRGVTYTNRPVLQPDLLVTLPVGPSAATTVTAGAWTSVEPARYAGPHDVSMLGAAAATATAAARFTVTQLWADATRGLRVGTLPVLTTVGAIGNWYPRAAGLASTYNSAELYARLAPALPLAPRVSVNLDVHAVRGAYLEAAVSHTVALGPRAAVTGGALAGWNAGDETTPREAGYFAGRGLTHGDLSLAAALTAGPVALAPSAHLVLARDAAARAVGPDRTRMAKWWLASTLTWSGHR